MKKIAIVLAILFVLSFPLIAHAQITKDQYYARSTLEGNELEFYDAAYDSIQNETDLYGQNYGIDLERAQEIINFVWGDSPELFEWDNMYTNEKAAEYQKQIEQKVNEIISNVITDGMTDYEKVEAVYDWVDKNVRYGESEEAGDEGQTIIGALLYNKAVCAGISRVFQYLLYKVDIQCYCADSDIHTWNIVQVDGQWYNVDLTRDEKYPNGTFLLSDEVFYKAHSAPDPEMNPPLPECPESYGDVMYYNYKTQRYEVAGEEEPTPTATPEPAVENTPAPVVANVEPQEPPTNGGNYTGWIIAIAAIGAIVAAGLGMRARKKKRIE